MNAAHALQRAAEDYDRKQMKGIDLKVDLGLSDATIDAKLKPLLKPKFDEVRATLDALALDLQKVVPEIE